MELTQIRQAAAADEQRAVILQAAAILLDYPTTDQAADLQLISAALRGSAAEAASGRHGLLGFVAAWERLSLRERQAEYVATFELSADHSLYMTSGGSARERHRGQCLLGLLEAYRRYGYEAACTELPDYLPMMLEFAAAVPEGVDLLLKERAALLALLVSLEESHSPFEAVVGAVVSAIGADDGGSEGVL